MNLATKVDIVCIRSCNVNVLKEVLPIEEIARAKDQISLPAVIVRIMPGMPLTEWIPFDN
ncbi:MAG TPA: hypothetical protein DF296_03185 [Candidatus Margulisbacteria bacterium]|nr:hypothetical protein [Candidatus Margulisiibacteriota bacterium]